MLSWHPDNPLQVVTFPIPIFLWILVHRHHVLATFLTFITKMLPQSSSQSGAIRGLDLPVIQLCGKCDISPFCTKLSHSSERQGKGTYVQLCVPEIAARAPQSQRDRWAQPRMLCSVPWVSWVSAVCTVGRRAGHKSALSPAFYGHYCVFACARRQRA